MKINNAIKGNLFSKEQIDKFTETWIKENVHDDHKASRELSDNDYVDYKIWEDINWEWMYNKHLPATRVIRGNNPNLIFHGGCLGCLSQRKHGVDRCKGCRYFKAGWDKPNLFIKGEKSSTMSQDDLNKIIRDQNGTK